MEDYAALIPPFELRLEPHVFLGFDPGDNWRQLTTTDARDSVGIIGPPGYGKTAGVLLPAILGWSGPVISTSTRGDVLRFCGDQRARIARAHGGKVLVYDPFGSEPGTRSMRWSPLAGCQDPRIAYRRAASMTSTVAAGVTEASHWRSGAARILRGFLHAAAVSGEPMSSVVSWVAAQNVERPAQLLRASSTRAPWWADHLLSLQRLGDRERGSFFSVTADALDAYDEPTVLSSAQVSELDIDQFLASHSTLFVVGPRHMQAAVAPLTVGLIDSMVERASELAAQAGGKLPWPLLLALDEIANTAPLESLPPLVSEGGGRNITTVWTVQALAQLRKRYGKEDQEAILAATTTKLVFGGMSNGGDLRDISAWAGDKRVVTVTHYTGGGDAAWRRIPRDVEATAHQGGGRESAIGHQWRPALPVDAIQQLPPLQAWMFHRSDPPVLVATPPAGLVPDFARLSGWSGDAPELEPAS